MYLSYLSQLGLWFNWQFVPCKSIKTTIFPFLQEPLCGDQTAAWQHLQMKPCRFPTLPHLPRIPPPDHHPASVVLRKPAKSNHPSNKSHATLKQARRFLKMAMHAINGHPGAPWVLEIQGRDRESRVAMLVRGISRIEAPGRIEVEGDDMTGYDEDVVLTHREMSADDKDTLEQLTWELASQEGRITGE